MKGLIAGANTRKRKKEGGFTLIELIVVIVILGILASVAIPKLVGSDEGAIISSMESDARNAISAENSYYAIERQYIDASVSDGQSTTLGTTNVKVSASPGNTVTITANNGGCADGSDGFSVTVSNTKTQKQVVYDSCTDTAPKVQ